jgi:hypothetical protein
MKRSEIKFKRGDHIRETQVHISIRQQQLMELVQSGNRDRYKANKEMAIWHDIKNILIALDDYDIDPHEFPRLLPELLLKRGKNQSTQTSPPGEQGRLGLA